MPGNILLDPLDFLQNNIVVADHPNLGDTQDSAGLLSMCLVPSATPAWQHGAEIPKFVLRRFRGQQNAVATFQAFWCPFALNETFTCELDASASLCFTAMMDGCTFAARPNGHQGQCTVVHANSQRVGQFGDNPRERQGADQDDNVAAALGDQGVSYIRPDDYRRDYDGAHVMRSSTFGLRVGGDWHFYTQRFQTFNGKTFLRNVVRKI